MNDAQPTIKAPLGGIENVAILQGRILDLEQQVNDQIERAVSAETDLAKEKRAHLIACEQLVRFREENIALDNKLGSAAVALHQEQRSHDSTRQLLRDMTARVRQLENGIQSRDRAYAQLAASSEKLMAERDDLKAHNLRCTARIVELEEQVDDLQEVIDKAAVNVGETIARLGQI